MSLGKRYIAIVNSNGNEVVINVNYDHGHQADLAFTRNVDSRATHVATLVVDLDDLPRTDESDEERYARNERVMLAACSEVERLKPIVGRPVGEPVPVAKDRGDLARLCHVLACARAALQVMEQHDGDEFAYLITATQRALGVSTDPESWPGGVRHVETERCDMPPPCSGCGGAESVCNCDCGGNYCGCDCHLAAEQAAIGGTP